MFASLLLLMIRGKHQAKVPTIKEMAKRVPFEVPAHLSEFSNVDFPMFGIPTTRTLSEGTVSLCSLAIAEQDQMLDSR